MTYWLSLVKNECKLSLLVLGLGPKGLQKITDTD